MPKPTPAQLGRALSALRRTKSGGRNGGRPRKPTACKCGVMCESVGAARAHCKLTLSVDPPPDEVIPTANGYSQSGEAGAWPVVKGNLR